MATVAIIGGGIAGLSAAYHLKRLSPDLSVLLFEKDDRLGGKILTERADGFVIEGGPDSFLASKPAALELCEELGIASELEGTDERHRGAYISLDRDLHRMPEGLSGLVPAQLDVLAESSLFSEDGKERLAREPEIPPRTEPGDESLAEFMTRRFGREVFERLIEPLMAGIYAGDAKQLSLAATFPQLKAMELAHGSLVRGGQVPSAATGGQGAPRGFLTPKGGMGQIVDALVNDLQGTRLATATAVQAIEVAEKGYRVTLFDGREVAAEAVICATPAFAAASMLHKVSPDLEDVLNSIPYGSTATVTLAFRESDVPTPLDATGYLVPRMEGRPILACTWVSSKFRNRAPGRSVQLRMFIGRFGDDDHAQATDDELVELARREVFAVLDIEARPLLQRVFRWPRAMPQYTMGHLERVGRIEDLLHEHPYLALAGNSYRGVGIPDCITSGERAALRVLEGLSVPVAQQKCPPQEGAIKAKNGGPDRI